MAVSLSSYVLLRSAHSVVSLLGELICATQVDGTAYCLHRYLFNLHSDTFSKTFLAGRKDTKSPIFLQDVEKSQFDAFLNVLYRTCVLLPSIWSQCLQYIHEASIFSSYTSNPIMAAPAWASVLHLASEWNFPSIRELAIQSFTPSASDVDKVVLGHRYRFEEWLLPGYTGLVERKEPLTLAEGTRLGIEDVVSINKARENIREASLNAAMPKIEIFQDIRCPSCGYTCNYISDGTQSTTKCPGSNGRGCSYNGQVTLATFTAKLPAPVLPSTDEISQKVKTLIPRSSLSYVPSPLTHCGFALTRLSKQALRIVT